MSQIKGSYKHTNEFKLRVGLANSDKTIYAFQHKDSGEFFVGTQRDFYRKYNLNQVGVNGLVKEVHRTIKGWRLLSPGKLAKLVEKNKLNN